MLADRMLEASSEIAKLVVGKPEKALFPLEIEHRKFNLASNKKRAMKINKQVTLRVNA